MQAAFFVNHVIFQINLLSNFFMRQKKIGSFRLFFAIKHSNQGREENLISVNNFKLKKFHSFKCHSARFFENGAGDDDYAEEGSGSRKAP